MRKKDRYLFGIQITCQKFKHDDLKNQDTSISLWQINNYLKSKKLSNTKKIQNLLCQHRANSFVLQFKASISIGCFETDIYYLKDKTLSTHDLKIDTNLIFDDFLKSNYGKNTVWMDQKILIKSIIAAMQKIGLINILINLKVY